MRALIVGAGAVGQVYARCLRKGGAEVCFFVREKYLDQVRRGFTMYPLNHGGALERVAGIPAIATLEDVAAQTWDQVWLCIPTTGLFGDWLAPFMEAIGDAVVVAFQPGLRVGELLDPHVPPERLAKGIIAFSSWPAPLPGSTRPEPGTAWWLPPLTPCLFEGPGAEEIAKTLTAGGLRSKVGPAEHQTTRGSAVLLTLVAALECAGWSFSAVRKKPWAGLAAAAGQQALAVATAHAGIKPGAVGLVASPFVEGLLLAGAPMVAPFDIERFFQVHFTKVGAQTIVAFDGWIEEGRRRQLPVDKLEELRAQLLQRRGPSAG